MPLVLNSHPSEQFSEVDNSYTLNKIQMPELNSGCDDIDGEIMSEEDSRQPIAQSDARVGVFEKSIPL